MLAPRAGVRVFVWALGVPPALRAARVTPLRGASEAGRSPSSGCPLPRGCQVCYPCAVGAGVQVWGRSTVPLACLPC